MQEIKAVCTLDKMYIASSHCPEDGHVRCASNPLIDNFVRYANCQVMHDGFECSRQDKVHNIVRYARENSDYLPLHVCWETQIGTNCCKCEKCYRTIVGILVENGDPARLGFTEFERNLGNMRGLLSQKTDGILKRQWTKIQTGLKENKKALKSSPYWKDIRWIEKADFEHPETIHMPVPIGTRVRQWLSQFRVYQHLHDLKEKAR